MKAVVLERQHDITVRDVPAPPPPGPGELRIAPKVVGICGSDVHYYTHGRIGRYVVEAPIGVARKFRTVGLVQAARVRAVACWASNSTGVW